MYCPKGMSSSTREYEDIEDSSYSEDELALCGHSSSSSGTLDSFSVRLVYILSFFFNIVHCFTLLLRRIS